MSKLPQDYNDLLAVAIALSLTDNDTLGKPIQAEGKETGIFHFETSFTDDYGNMTRINLVLGNPIDENFDMAFTLNIRCSKNAEASYGFYRLAANQKWMFAENVTLPNTPVDRLCPEEFNIFINNAFALYYKSVGSSGDDEFHSYTARLLTPPTFNKLDIISDLEKERQEKEQQQLELEQKLAAEQRRREFDEQTRRLAQLELEQKLAAEQRRREFDEKKLAAEKEILKLAREKGEAELKLARENQENQEAELKLARQKEAADIISKARQQFAEKASINRVNEKEKARINEIAEAARRQRETSATPGEVAVRTQQKTEQPEILAARHFFFKLLETNNVKREGDLKDKPLSNQDFATISKFIATHGRNVVVGWWNEYKTKNTSLDF